MNGVERHATHALADSYASAARIVTRVLDGRSLGDALGEEPSEGRLRAAAQDLAYRTLRAYGRVDALADRLLERPAQDRRLYALLLVALCELDERTAPDHTVVDQAVNSTALLELPRGRGLVNAVLRGFGRRREQLDAELQGVPVSRYRHPAWWIASLQAAYPSAWEAILEQGNTHPPMTLRVNRRRGDVPAYLGRLEQAGIAATRVGEWGLLLERPWPVAALPGFFEGDASVQDASAQVAAPLLDASDGMTVLDACAAPGGKAGHILEMARCRVTALDASATRAGRVRDNLRRLGLEAEVLVSDALKAEGVLAGRRFQRILLDAPCTASGVVRRHPDAKWLRRPSDTGRFARIQAQLLDVLWRLLEPDGKLLYATCSVFPEENGDAVSGFLDRHPDARRLPVPFSAAGQDGQILPASASDGFYYALMSKNSR